MITVFGDAPDENKELAETETCEGDGGDYIFEPSENPWVRTRSLRPKKRKDRQKDGLGRSDRVRTCDLDVPNKYTIVF